MPKCPQCQREFIDLPAECPSCMADLELLVEYVQELHGGLQDAERMIQSGRLAEAVWAYLSVLEVDPDNPEASRQVGQVATAVRQFDRTSPGRRWLSRIRGERIPTDGPALLKWLLAGVLGLILLIGSFTFGYLLGATNHRSSNGSAPPITEPKDTMSGK